LSRAGDRAGALGRLSHRRKLRRARREARDFVKETGKLLRKHGHKVAPKARERIEGGVAEVEAARERDNPAEILKAARALSTQVDRHLGFARKSTLREYVESIGLAVMIALLLRAFVLEAFKIPSGSMIPTLRVGDHIFVNKFAYGLRMPFTKWWFVERDEVKRGDVVVFMFPEDESKDFIKRIVAIPGDTVEVRDHQLLITDGDGKAVDVGRKFLTHDFQYHEEDDRGGQVVRAVAMQETLGQSSYQVIFRKDVGRPNFGPVKVHLGHVFVMGDNRDNSHDARFWGDGTGQVQVPMGNIKGRAMFIWWSSYELGRIGSSVD
jgi:signal peptidase I